MQKIKVVHFITSIDKSSGGTTTYLKLLTEQIAAEVDITVVAGLTPSPVPLSGVKVRHFDMSGKKLFQFKKEIASFLDELKPDLVHINGIWELPNVVMQNVAEKKGIPVIISPHGMLEPWIMNKNRLKKVVAMILYQRKSIKKANCLHATAESEQNNILELGFNNHIEIIENGIKTENVRIKKSWERTKTILFLSRVHPKKGIENLIDAIVEMNGQFSTYKVIIAGEGDPAYVDQLKARVRKKQVDENLFDFRGGVYGEAKWELYRQADVFALPTYSENFGIVIPEALISGTPVITTVGAPWKDLEQYHCGWWIKCGVEPLKEALSGFVEKSESELKEMGLNGQRLVEEKYTDRSMGKKMVQLYKSQLSIT